MGTPATYGSYECAIKTANVGSSVHTKKCGHNCQGWQLCRHASKLPTLAVLRTLFGPSTHNCQPWQFYGHFSAPPTFSKIPIHSKLPTLAVLWTLFGLSKQNCQPWQFFRHFSTPPICVLPKLQTWQLNGHFSAQKPNCKVINKGK